MGPHSVHQDILLLLPSATYKNQTQGNRWTFEGSRNISSKTNDKIHPYTVCQSPKTHWCLFLNSAVQQIMMLTTLQKRKKVITAFLVFGLTKQPNQDFFLHGVSVNKTNSVWTQLLFRTLESISHGLSPDCAFTIEKKRKKNQIIMNDKGWCSG